MDACARCGKLVILDGDKRRYAAVEVTKKDSTDSRVAEFARLQAGPYEVGKMYRICMECYLEIFGVKP